MMDKSKEAIFNDLLAKYQEKVYRICLGYLYHKSLAEDCFQEVLINIWKSLDKFRNESSIHTYIYRITVNTTITFNNKQKRQSKWQSDIPINDNLHSGNDDNEQSEKEQQLAQLYAAIQQLKEQERFIITMVLEGISNKEIAEVLGIPANNVGVKIHRIKQTLSNIIKV